MQKIIAAKTHTLVSLTNQELVALSNCVNEVVNNSNVDEHNCHTRIAMSLPELRSLLGDLGSAIDAAGTDPFELFEANKEGFSIQLRAISALGCPADLSYEHTLQRIQQLEDKS